MNYLLIFLIRLHLHNIIYIFLVYKPRNHLIGFIDLLLPPNNALPILYLVLHEKPLWLRNPTSQELLAQVFVAIRITPGSNLKFWRPILFEVVINVIAFIRHNL